MSTITENRKAGFNYFIEERIEAGLALEGWEVKAIRAGRVQIQEAYVIVPAIRWCRWTCTTRAAG